MIRFLQFTAVAALFVTTALSESDSSTTTAAPTSNYQLCFTLKSLSLSNIDFHQRKSAYGTPSAQVHLFDPSLRSPAIRSFDLALRVSPDPNVTSYTYDNLNTKLCWLNTASTQLYFDFEIFQFYHVAMRVGYLLNTGLSSDGSAPNEDFKQSSLNLTSGKAEEYRGVRVSLRYEFELKLLSNDQFAALRDGSDAIDGSLSASAVAANAEEVAQVADTSGEFNELDAQAQDREMAVVADGANDANDASESTGKHGNGTTGSSDNVGLILSAIVAAMVGFAVLVAVVIYLVRMYSRKDYVDMDRNRKQKNRNNGGNARYDGVNGVNGMDGMDRNEEYYEEVNGGVKGRMRRISLRDTKDRMQKIRDAIGTKTSISLPEKHRYQSITDPSLPSGSYQNGKGMETQQNAYDRDTSRSGTQEGSDDDQCIDVSIITNESHGLP